MPVTAPCGDSSHSGRVGHVPPLEAGREFQGYQDYKCRKETRRDLRKTEGKLDLCRMSDILMMDFRRDITWDGGNYNVPAAKAGRVHADFSPDSGEEEQQPGVSISANLLSCGTASKTAAETTNRLCLGLESSLVLKILSLLFSCSVMSNFLQLRGPQHSRLPCASLSSGQICGLNE